MSNSLSGIVKSEMMKLIVREKADVIDIDMIVG
jgi:hypothetical protein